MSSLGNKVGGAPGVSTASRRADFTGSAVPAPLPLTPRQVQVVELVSHGFTNREIAERLGIRSATVKRHLERIYDRAGVRTRAGVAAKLLLEAKQTNLPA